MHPASESKLKLTPCQQVSEIDDSSVPTPISNRFQVLDTILEGQPILECGSIEFLNLKKELSGKSKP